MQKQNDGQLDWGPRKSMLVLWIFLVGFALNTQKRLYFSKPVTKCRALSEDGMAPVEKFRWNHSASDFAQWNQVMATPSVGDLDGDKIPEIVFTSYTGRRDLVEKTYLGQGVLRILDGKTGREKKAVGQESLAPFGATTPLLIDIEGDGRAEIIYMHHTLQEVIALNHDGTLRWNYKLNSPLRSCFGGLSAGDLNGNGRAEIIVENLVLEESSEKTETNFPKLNARFLSQEISGTSCTAFAMSLNPKIPDELQIVNGTGVYSARGQLLWNFSAAFDPTHRLFLAAADIRPEIEGIEVITVDQGVVSLYKGTTGELIWSIMTPSDSSRFNGMPGRGGPPNVADYDGDGHLEIGLANAVYYSVFNHLGQLKWSQPNHDYTSNVTGSSAFDFNGDGTSEAIYADEGYLKIYDGKTGATLGKIQNPSHTLLENPVIADIDGDSEADLLLVSNDSFDAVSDLGKEGEQILKQGSGLRVFSAKQKGSWASAKPVWNQYSYFSHNVTSQLRAPASTPTDTLKTFRQNTSSQIGTICENSQDL